MDQEKKQLLLSDTISVLRFPLIVAVVIIHTYITGQPNINGKIYVPFGKFPLFDIIEQFIRKGIAELAVPLFFLISGFLFFYLCEFNFTIYKNKLKKRINSLLIPYLFFNSLYLLYVFLTQLFFPNMTSPDRKLIIDYTIIDYFDSYWSYDGIDHYAPIYGPLWFIRDLIVINIFSPIIYFLIKKIDIIYFIILSLLFLFGIGLLTPGIASSSVLFYSIGSWFAIKKKNFVCDYATVSMIIGITALLLLIIDTYLWSKGEQIMTIHRLFILLGSISVPSICGKIIDRRHIKPIKILAESSFFIYVTHRFIITFFNKYWVLILPVNTISCIVAFLTIPIITCLICFTIYISLKKVAPTLTRVITGGR